MRHGVQEKFNGAIAVIHTTPRFEPWIFSPLLLLRETTNIVLSIYRSTYCQASGLFVTRGRGAFLLWTNYRDGLGLSVLLNIEMYPVIYWVFAFDLHDNIFFSIRCVTVTEKSSVNLVLARTGSVQTWYKFPKPAQK